MSSPMLLSEHIKRYRGVSIEKLEVLADQIEAFFTPGKVVDEESAHFIVDFASII